MDSAKENFKDKLQRKKETTAREKIYSKHLTTSSNIKKQVLKSVYGANPAVLVEKSLLKRAKIWKLDFAKTSRFCRQSKNI